MRKRTDILFIDLDKTLWDGIWGESKTSEVDIAKIAFLRNLLDRGICPCILTNITPKNKVIRVLISKGIDPNFFIGIISCDGPKLLCIERVLKRLSVPWRRVSIVDDDPVIRRDFKERGAIVFSDFNELMNFNWSENHPILNKQNVKTRFQIRRTGFEILDLKPTDQKSDYLIQYLKNINFKIQINVDDQQISSRIPELFFRTTQMHFNKKLFENLMIHEITKKINKYLKQGSKICTISMAFRDSFLGVQGVLLYEETNNKVNVYNATFSCSVISFKIVEKLAIMKFVNNFVENNKIVHFKMKLTEYNERVSWLMCDLGAIQKNKNEFVFKSRININPEILLFIEPIVLQKKDYGVPPVTTFYDNFVEPLISKMIKPKLLDIGYGFGEILEIDRYNKLKSIFLEKKGTFIKADVKPKDDDTLNMDVQQMIGIKSSSIEIVFCLELLEHVEDPAKAISEILRVLKKGGLLFISTPGAIYPYHPVSKDFSRFSSRFLVKILSHFGKVIEKEIQQYSRFELRTILLFEKEKDSDKKKIKSIFKAAKSSILLPSKLGYYN